MTLAKLNAKIDLHTVFIVTIPSYTKKLDLATMRQLIVIESIYKTAVTGKELFQCCLLRVNIYVTWDTSFGAGVDKSLLLWSKVWRRITRREKPVVLMEFLRLALTKRLRVLRTSD